MVSRVEAAQAAARQALERTYTGNATVIERQKVKNPVSKMVESQDVPVIKNQPCKISYKSVTAAIREESAASTEQVVKLLISPALSIKPGSKITVVQEGVTVAYTHSGVPAVYPTHQEIVLDLFKGWA